MPELATPQKRSSRKYWIKFHAYLSVFFFPFAIVYASTGALYIWGDAKTKIESRITLFHPDSVSPSSIQEVEPIIRKECDINDWKVPSGSLRKDGPKIKWGSKNSVSIEYRPSRSTQGKAYITFTEVTLYGRLLNFHKAKGGTFLDCLGTAFALLLFGSYLSGIYLAFKSPKLRKTTLISFILGATAITLALFLGF